MTGLAELFNQDPVTVAKELIGRELIRTFGNSRIVKGELFEVRAWGEHSERELEFTEHDSGIVSVSKYGRSYMIDVSVQEGRGCVTLIGAIFPDIGGIANTAGKLADGLQIDEAFNGYDLVNARSASDTSLASTLRLEGHPYEGTILERRWARAPDNWQGTFYVRPQLL